MDAAGDAMLGGTAPEASSGNTASPRATTASPASRRARLPFRRHSASCDFSASDAASFCACGSTWWAGTMGHVHPFSRNCRPVTAADPNKRHSRVRRWLTYTTLFLAASILVGDVISLIYSLLGGEITSRFLLKVLVVGFIAGTVFWYYLSTLDDARAE